MTLDQANRDFWCYVEGDITTFQVTAPSESNVDHLKEIIYGKRHRVLSDIDPIDLVLWKVCEKKSNVNLRADFGLQAHSTGTPIVLSLYPRTHSIPPHAIP